MIVGFGNTKGGVGKSLLAANIAVSLFDQGLRVALVDSDEQGTAIRAVKGTEPKIETRNPTRIEDIDDAVQELKRTHDVVLVDTPGTSGEAVSTLCIISDMLIIPLQPSKRDLLATGAVLKLVRTAQRRRRQKPETTIVINFSRKRDVAARELRKAMSSRGIAVARNVVRRLDAFRDSDVVVRGGSPDEQDAAGDIEMLVHELFTKKLSLKRRRRVLNG